MTSTTISSPLHPLLLLSDSALPLGSFAFSSGLESFLAHTKTKTTTTTTTTFPPHQTPQPNKSNPANPSTQQQQTFPNFLQHSLLNTASTSLPYVLTAYHRPSLSALEDLDNDFDASTPCTVARRASVTQGRALLGIWERALAASAAQAGEEAGAAAAAAARSALDDFVVLLKDSRRGKGKGEVEGLSAGLNAHFAPLFGTVCAALGLTARDTAYLFLLNHAKAVLSAAVRASVMGPYQSHALLASGELQGWIREGVEREGGREVEEAVVTVPVMDVWMGRHELLYSRIFNS